MCENFVHVWPVCKHGWAHKYSVNARRHPASLLRVKRSSVVQACDQGAVWCAHVIHPCVSCLYLMLLLCISCFILVVWLFSLWGQSAPPTCKTLRKCLWMQWYKKSSSLLSWQLPWTVLTPWKWRGRMGGEGECCLFEAIRFLDARCSRIFHTGPLIHQVATRYINKQYIWSGCKSSSSSLCRQHSSSWQV